MNIVEFYKKWNYKILDADGINGGQCVDVIKQYFKDVLSIPPIKGNAIDYFKEIPGFKLFKKSLFTYPKPDDIIIFDIGQYGHIGLCVWTRTFDFCIFQQNDPIGTPCSFRIYNYKKVIGWLRPIKKMTILKYTCFNADQSICEEARKLLQQYTDNKVNVEFIFKGSSTFFYPGRMTTENQVDFLKKFPVYTPFAYVVYTSDTPTYDFMATAEVPGTKIIMTEGEPNPTPFNLCYEFVHAITQQLLQQGHPIGIPDDVNTPKDEFIKKKIEKIMPYLLDSGI